jgi:glucose-6-phosphate dehydrogenase assembly protein OpcA
MTATTPLARDEALGWLATQLRWERQLADLRRHAEATGEPVLLTTPDLGESRAA